MPRIDPLPPEQASADLKAAWATHIAEYPGSRITNMKATLSHSPLAFTVYMHWYPLYTEVQRIVGNRLAYLFAHAISAGSACPLCTMFFRKIIIDSGERPENLHLNDLEQALLTFGSSMAQHKGEVSDDLYRVVATNYSAEELVVLIAFVGQMMATNVFNNALHVDIDDYLAPYYPVTIESHD